MRVSIGRARWLGVGAVAKRRSTGLSETRRMEHIVKRLRRNALVRSSSKPNIGVDSGSNGLGSKPNGKKAIDRPLRNS